jgi:hypothetical protein
MFLSWNDFYSGSCTEYSQRTTRLSSFSGTAYIVNSFFKGLSSSSYGGSIYYSSSSSNLLMLIESSTFINSQSGGQGGAIFFSSPGQFVKSKVCGYGCKSTSNKVHFCYVHLTNSISYRNDIYDSAICCSTQPSYQHASWHIYGKIIIKQTNFSSNSCYSRGPVGSLPSSNGDHVASSISYSTVANNVVSNGHCICFDLPYLCEIDSCNIISNIDQSSNKGLIYVCGSLNLRGSCIINNSATYLIQNVGGYTITATNCTIDSTSICSGSTTIVSTPGNSFINRIKYIETALCYSSYDFVVFPTKNYPYGVPPDKVEIFLEMYCNKHAGNEIIRAFNYILMHSLVSDGW